jgi:glycosyltransferase involved in cell wall biosynthesis
MLGRLTTLKGGDRLIEAVPAVEAALGRSLSLIIGGTGPELERWRILAARRGVAAEFVGWVEPERRLELLRESDVLVVPSLWPEPFGLVGIEAGCVGVPSVGYAVGGIPDWLVPGETGELAPGDPPTTAGLAEAIVRALGDPTHHARLRLGAWQMSKRFRMEDHLSALLPQLESACRT